MGSFLKQGARPWEIPNPSPSCPASPTVHLLFLIFSTSALPSPLQEDTPSVTPLLITSQWSTEASSPTCEHATGFLFSRPMPGFQAASVLLPEIKELEILGICGGEGCGRVHWNRSNTHTHAHTHTPAVSALSPASKNKLTGLLKGTSSEYLETEIG